MNRCKRSLFALVGPLCLSSLALAQPEPEMEMEPDALSEPPPEPVSDPDPMPDPEPAPEMESEPIGLDTSATVSASAETVDADWNLGIAPRLGLAVPTSKLSPFVSFGLELGYRLPTLDNRLSVVADVAYTQPGRSASVNDARAGGDADYEIDESELKLGLGGNFRLFGDDHKLVPWAGAAAVMQRLESAETNDLAPGENTSTDVELGGEISAGADYRLGIGYAFGEARMVFTDLDHLITGNSNAGNVNLSVGYRLVL